MVFGVFRITINFLKFYMFLFYLIEQNFNFNDEFYVRKIQNKSLLI